jgi:hypothetical protein
METHDQNINVIRSAWRRIKKDIKVRDLQPVKDVKGGGGGVTGKSKPITGGTGTTAVTNRVKESRISIPLQDRR